MVEPERSDGEQQLSVLAERFSHWRTTKTQRGDPIPEALWAEVCSLSKVLPRRQICRVLRLSDRDLQKRLGVEHVPSSPHPTPTPPLSFIEMTAAVARATPAPATTVTEVAFERPDGARLQLHYVGELAQLAPLVQSFLTAR